MRLATSALLIVIFSTLLTPAVLFENQIELTSSENDDLQLNLNNIKTISFEIVNDETKTLNFQDSDQSKPRQEKMVESKSSDLSLETAGLESNIPIFTPLELISPEFGTPPADNITYEEGSTGNTIKWKVNEDNPDRYNVYANGTFLNSNTWSTGFVFTNVDTLSLGIWNITVFF